MNDELVRIRVADLRDAGVPEPVIGQIKNLGAVEYADGGEVVTVTIGVLILGLILWLVAGTITTWVFTAILHQVGIAPWEIWE